MKITTKQLKQLIKEEVRKVQKQSKLREARSLNDLLGGPDAQEDPVFSKEFAGEHARARYNEGAAADLIVEIRLTQPFGVIEGAKVPLTPHPHEGFYLAFRGDDGFYYDGPYDTTEEAAWADRPKVKAGGLRYGQEG